MIKLSAVFVVALFSVTSCSDSTDFSARNGVLSYSAIDDSNDGGTDLVDDTDQKEGKKSEEDTDDKKLCLIDLSSPEMEVDEDKYICEDGKVAICHVPSGNSSNAHVIRVSGNALDAHVGKHGDEEHKDYVISCESEAKSGDKCDVLSKCEEDIVGEDS